MALETFQSYDSKEFIKSGDGVGSRAGQKK
jgi:hypothetical protein